MRARRPHREPWRHARCGVCRFRARLLKSCAKPPCLRRIKNQEGFDQCESRVRHYGSCLVASSSYSLLAAKTPGWMRHHCRVIQSLKCFPVRAVRRPPVPGSTGRHSRIMAAVFFSAVGVPNSRGLGPGFGDRQRSAAESGHASRHDQQVSERDVGRIENLGSSDHDPSFLSIHWRTIKRVCTRKIHVRHLAARGPPCRPAQPRITACRASSPSVNAAGPG